METVQERTEYVTIAGICFDVEYTVKVNVDYDIDCTDVDLVSVDDVSIQGDSVECTRIVIDGKPLMEIIEKEILEV